MARPRKYAVEDGSTPNLFPVRLLRSYVPMAEYHVEGELPDTLGGKLLVGTEVDLPLEEARSLIERGIAVRNDNF